MATPVGPATMLWTTYKKWIIAGAAALILGCCALLGLTALVSRNATLAANPPAPTQEAPVYTEAPTESLEAPAATEPPAAPNAACSPLSISDFNQKWSSTPVDNPGPLMVKLDEWFDQGGYQCGGASPTGNWNVPAGTILWTDLKHLEVVPADGGTLKNGDIVRLRCQGDWCVFAVYREVTVPTPGRYAILERWLDPANDLAGW